MNMEEIVALSVKHNVSDLHLCSAWPARWRIRGRMEAAPFDAPDVEELLREWLDDDQRAILLENGQLDFAVSLAENQRLRGSAFAQRQGTSQRCLIQQREIGLHCMTFASGLRAALREDPDVILLGELRDSETIRLALTAAETGHLVLATLHTRGAAQAVERLVDSFPAQEKDPVRNQLAGSLRAVLSQKLEVDKQEGRVALFELLINTPAVGNLIREGKTHQLPHVIQTGQQVGMITFQQSYQQRVKEGRL
ncbi:type IV pili twitching motility protein PilT [Escherichia coli]|uniref:ATPase, T2SS/T4P/T4SS family n=1 Tax=Escherichia coli TaxID=562 RepID=UPI000CF140CC|nr:ATPase, T2SS/T4P/T4SS family [Escherichia coli]PPW80592.1 type IV pili twitching motility protein PilT [Escherichia coli]